jgi:hypothetical protein
VVRAAALEVLSILAHLDVELSESILDVASLFVLEREDGFLDWSKSSFTDLNESSLRVLEFDEEIFLHLELMPLQEHDSLLHWLNLVKSPVLDHLHVSEMSHDSHQELLVLCLLSRLWEDFDSCGDLSNEGFNVGDLSGGVVQKETRVGVDPLTDSVLELFDERCCVDSEPSDVD